MKLRSFNPSSIIFVPEYAELRFLQTIIVLFAVIGCLAVALGGFYAYKMMKSGTLALPAVVQNQTTQTLAAQPSPTPLTSANPELAAVLNAYQPTPAPQAGGLPQPGAATVAAVSSTPRPIPTPAMDKAIRQYAQGRKLVALTYDDGPHPTWTPKMIELLRSKNVKATFFVQGPNVEKHPEIAKDLYTYGFELGNHTMTHPEFNKSAMTKEKITAELADTTQRIIDYSGQSKVEVMRPPYGQSPKKLLEVCQDLGLYVINWSIDTDDWRSKTNDEQMVANIMKNLSDGAIILMHDKHEKTYTTTEKVIDQIREKGYEFVTVSELLGLKAIGQTSPAPQVVAPAVAPVQAGVPVVTTVAPVATPVAAPGDGSLPVPQVVVQTPVVPSITEAGFDSSKITTPPPSRNR